MRSVEMTVAVAAVSFGLVTSAMGANGTWNNSPAGSDWSSSANWVSGSVPGDNAGAASTNGDVATFGASSNYQVNPDSGRALGTLTFNNAAGAYIIGPAVGANQLVVRGNTNGSNTSTITFNSPILQKTDGNLAPASNQTFNYNGVFTGQAGLSVLPRGGAGSVVNFNAGVASSVSNNGSNFRSWLATATININAATSFGYANFYDIAGTLNLNAASIINTPVTLGAQAYVGVSNGAVNVKAANAVTGNSYVWLGTVASGTSPVAKITYGQDYTGRLAVPVSTSNNGNKRTAGTGRGTLVGNTSSYDPDSAAEYNSLPIIGTGGYTVSAATSVAGTLWANNTSGSATGNSDVNIVTGTLGGNGFITNSDVSINTYNIPGTGTTPTVFSQGVTLHKRQQVTAIANNTGYTDYFNGVTPATLGSYGLTATGAATYGKLSPGASAGAIGTLTMDLGSKGLNIAYAVQDANSQTLLFDLSTVASSDKVRLLNTGGSSILNIGAATLEFDDFVFTAPGALPNGTYTLFDTNAAVTGTLGSNLTGTIPGTGGQIGTIALSGAGQDVVLIIPEPTSLTLAGLAGMVLIGGRRRR